MDGIYGKIDVFPEHFQSIKASEESPQGSSSSVDHKLRSRSHSWTVRRVLGAASLLNLFSLPRLPWGSGNDDDKVELTRAEFESLWSEIEDAEDREMHLKSQLEHADGVLRCARLCAYLYVRTRWTQLPGEPPIIDDDDIDDWIPRFVVLHGSCIYYYLRSFGNLLASLIALFPFILCSLRNYFIRRFEQMIIPHLVPTCHVGALEDLNASHM
ncbi:hypothetical protein ZIOFF_008994 [Zingiber officinale]|uniref:Uncharacterized protein n=1 Tax=Zingiber officinale TaxID=94328 RepID=A0A8J5LVR5_ZINOF|nr:hypothetical protein ZIOFF_008994 [Zingiber officinale]